jgi:hypothetical protein
MDRQRIMEAVAAMPTHLGVLEPDDMDASVNATGDKSEILSTTIDTTTRIRGGPSNPFRIALPAYESPGSTNGTGDDSETFTLAHDLMECPNTRDVVVWLDGDYYGSPDSVDYAADEITVTDSGTNSTVHVYYMVDEPASLTVEKKAPTSKSSAKQRLYTASLRLVNQVDHKEEPEFFQFSKVLGPLLAADMQLRVTVDAPYTIRFTDPDGDGTEPTNALFQVPIEEGNSRVDGFKSLVRASMMEG